LRICIDITSNLFGPSGIERYLKNLIPELINLNKENSYILYENNSMGRYKIQNIPKNPNVSFISVRWPMRLLHKLWDTWNIPKIERFVGEIDLFHSPHCILPPLRNGSSILTVNDMGYISHPDYYSNKKLTGSLGSMLIKAIKNADQIIAISEATKKDIIEITGIPEEKVNVVYLASEDTSSYIQKFTIEIKQRILSKWNINRPFLLYVTGTIDPRKNLGRVIDAFGIFLETTKLDWLLVFVGNSVAIKSDIGNILESSSFRDRIFLLDRIANNDLWGIMASAEVFIYPSLFEGFGLPVIEAMACGTAVVTSNISSMPEVAGDAAILVDPFIPEQIAYGIAKVALDESLRKELEYKGKQRAKLFSWRKTAEETMWVYKKACGMLNIQ